jgi:Holliday junction resolvase RusA-like endonuclease
MSEVNITVPLEPPSVNHYKDFDYRGGKRRVFVTKETKAFKMAIFLMSRDKQVVADAYEVHIGIFQGKGSRGDLDNYAKCVLDGLVDAGVIHTDSAVIRLVMAKSRDWVNPRTDIRVVGL